MKMIIKCENGGTAVELALILFPLILILFGITEFGLLLYNKQVITNASREGARAGIIVRSPRLTNDEIRDVVKGYCQKYLFTFGEDILTDEDIPILPIYNDPSEDFDPITQRCVTFGCDLEVPVGYDYEFLVLGPIKIHLKAVSVMKME